MRQEQFFGPYLSEGEATASVHRLEALPANDKRIEITTTIRGQQYLYWVRMTWEGTK